MVEAVNARREAADLIAENVQLVALSEGALAERLESLHNEVEELREANAQLQKRDLERGVVLEQSVPLADLLCAKAEADGVRADLSAARARAADLEKELISLRTHRVMDGVWGKQWKSTPSAPASKGIPQAEAPG